MTTKQRKIGFSEVYFCRKDSGEEQNYRDPKFIYDILNHVLKLPAAERQLAVKTGGNEKIHKLENFKINEKGYIEILFASFKTGYIPPISNKKTGRERANDKNLNEGDNEYTHFLLDCKSIHNKAIMLRESNPFGMSSGVFKKYIEHFGRTLLKSIDEEDQTLKVELEHIVAENIDEVLASSNRISELIITSQKETIKTQWEQFANLDDFNEIKETVDIVIKPEFRKSLPVRSLRKIAETVSNIAGSPTIKRIRIKGKDELDEPFFYDSDIFKRFKAIDVDFNRTSGLIVSEKMFELLNMSLENYHGS